MRDNQKICANDTTTSLKRNALHGLNLGEIEVYRGGELNYAYGLLLIYVDRDVLTQVPNLAG